MEQQLPHKVLPQLQLVEQVRRAVQLEQELSHNPHLAASGDTSLPMLEQV